VVTAVPDQHFYRHAGLTLVLDERLPALTEIGPVDADVHVRVVEPGKVVEHDLPWSSVCPFVWRAPDGELSWLRARYEYRGDWAEFVIDPSGEHAWITRSHGIRLAEVTELLTGQMFSSLAAQRGLTCVHSSVVRVADRVIAMIGQSGAGKSSTALALVKWSGGELVADDVAVLSERDGRVSVAIGMPRLRVREAPGRALVDEYEGLDQVWAEDRPLEPKRYLQINDRGAPVDEGPLPVDALYFLAPWSDDVPAPEIRDLSPVAALPRLMAERHMLATISKRSDMLDFNRLATLLRTAPARELFRPAGLDTMQQTVHAIVFDVRTLG
jgi:hypothetical protein